MPNVLFANLPFLLRGAIVTLELSAVCVLLASVIGIVAALAQSYGNLVVRGIALMYLYLMRGTPLLVMVFAAYYLLPYVGIDVESHHRRRAGRVAVFWRVHE